jgi:hypothetical protein
MRLATTEEIIIHWIKRKLRAKDPVFYSYDLESDLPVYGRLAHQKTHTASTYSRAFRKLRESNTLSKSGIGLQEVEHNNSKVKGWKIIRK